MTLFPEAPQPILDSPDACDQLMQEIAAKHESERQTLLPKAIDIIQLREEIRGIGIRVVKGLDIQRLKALEADFWDEFFREDPVVMKETIGSIRVDCIVPSDGGDHRWHLRVNNPHPGNTGGDTWTDFFPPELSQEQIKAIPFGDVSFPI